MGRRAAAAPDAKSSPNLLRDHLEEDVAISPGDDPSKSSPPHGARVRKLSRVRVRKGSTIFTPEPPHGDGGGRYASDHLNA